LESINSTSPYISTLPKELIAIIMSHLRNNPLFKFGITCTKFRPWYNDEMEQRIVIFLSNVLNFGGGYHDACCESLKRRMEQTIKKPEITTLKIMDLEKSQSDDTCSPTVWVMDNELKFPNDKICESLDTLVINFTDKRDFKPDESFWKKFPNLKTILLNGVDMYGEVLLMLSKFPLLESLFLYHCRFWAPHSMSTIFDYCTTLKEIHINRDDSNRMDIDLTIPQQLEIFELTSKGEVCLKLKRSMNLQSLSVNCDYLTIIVKNQLAFLEFLKLACSLSLTIQGNVKDLVTNVKELYINAAGCCTVFGALSDSTTTPYLNEVPKFILRRMRTYHWNFLMFQHIKRVMIETSNDRDNMLCAFPLTDGFITVKHIFVQNDKYTESKPNFSLWPIIVKYSPGKESTEKKSMRVRNGQKMLAYTIA